MSTPAARMTRNKRIPYPGDEAGAPRPNLQTREEVRAQCNAEVMLQLEVAARDFGVPISWIRESFAAHGLPVVVRAYVTAETWRAWMGCKEDDAGTVDAPEPALSPKHDRLWQKAIQLAGGANRRARREGMQGHVTSQELHSLLRAGRCMRPGCTETFRLDIDHIIPYGLGGMHVAANLCLLCGKHHREKTRAEKKHYSSNAPLVPWAEAIRLYRRDEVGMVRDDQASAPRQVVRESEHPNLEL